MTRRLGHPGLRGLGTSRTGVIWPLVIGMRKAKELYYTGDSVSGAEAERIGMINYSWPKDELEERTIAMADRIANLSADHLAILKLNMNRFYENMGIYSSVRSSTDMDAAGQFTRSPTPGRTRCAKSAEAGTGLKGGARLARRPIPGLSREAVAATAEVPLSHSERDRTRRCCVAGFDVVFGGAPVRIMPSGRGIVGCRIDSAVWRTGVRGSRSTHWRGKGR